MEAGVRFGMASVLWHMWCMVCSLPIAWSHFEQVLQFFTPKLAIYIESEISSTLTASFEYSQNFIHFQLCLVATSLQFIYAPTHCKAMAKEQAQAALLAQN